MKICLLGNPNSIHIQRWVNYFHSRGHEIYLIGEHPFHGSIQKYLRFYDLTGITNLRKIRYLVWAIKVRGILKEIKPDILHAHNVTSAGWLAGASGFHPFMVTAHGSDLMLLSDRSWAHTFLARWVLERSDFVTCVSQGLADIARKLGVPDHRLEVARLGIDLNIFHQAPDKLDLRSKLELASGPVIMSIRALKSIYNPLDIARAIPLILENFPNAQFLILTYNHDPEILSQFKTILSNHGVHQEVKYVGELENDQELADYYRAADIALSVPSSDGTPNSVLEAMACEAALVLSDIPPLHELAVDRVEAIFVPVGEPKEISFAVTRLLSDDELRQKIQSNASSRVRNNSDHKIQMHHYELLYEQVIRGCQ